MEPEKIDLKEEAYEEENKSEGDNETSDEEKNSKHSSDNEDGEDDIDDLSLEQIRRQLASRLTIGKGDDEQTHPHLLNEFTLDGIVEYIKEGRANNIIVMAGAGISTSAGIPDFRTPGTGLYDNLEKYKLPYPQAVFDIRYFKENPKPFFLLAKELYPSKFKPTPSHFFVKMLEEKNLLLRHYTQNIDTLERLAGIDPDKLVEAHGTFHSAHCIKCGKEFSQEWMKEQIFSDSLPKCDKCGSLVKPDIVFFGESLSDRFITCVQADFLKCDLLLIMGTSLVVQPFASLIDRVSETCPRALFNMEKAGVVHDLVRRGEGLLYDSSGNYRDVYVGGETDATCRLLAEKLGWAEDLDKLIKSYK